MIRFTATKDLRICDDMTLKKLSSMRRNGILTDLSLICGTTVFPIHKLVLAASSSRFNDTFFADTFVKNERQSTILIPDVNPEDVENLIKYMYKGELEIPEVDLPGLLKVARHLEIDGLREELGVRVPANLTNTWVAATGSRKKARLSTSAIFMADRLYANHSNVSMAVLSYVEPCKFDDSEGSLNKVEPPRKPSKPVQQFSESYIDRKLKLATRAKENIDKNVSLKSSSLLSSTPLPLKRNGRNEQVSKSPSLYGVSPSGRTPRTVKRLQKSPVLERTPIAQSQNSTPTRKYDLNYKNKAQSSIPNPHQEKADARVVMYSRPTSTCSRKFLPRFSSTLLNAVEAFYPETPKADVKPKTTRKPCKKSRQAELKTKQNAKPVKSVAKISTKSPNVDLKTKRCEQNVNKSRKKEAQDIMVAKPRPNSKTFVVVGNSNQKTDVEERKYYNTRLRAKKEKEQLQMENPKPFCGVGEQ